jgi:RimJ/RimL family protein N-acetyltransferase
VQTETARLLLRPFTTADFDDLYSLYSDPEVMRYIGAGVRTREETEQGMVRTADHWSRIGLGMWAVFEKDTGRFVGRCGLQPLAETPEIEVGYALHREFWGRGYATEGALAALRFGFETAGLNRIVAIARPENTGSRHVMEKAGMTYERTVPSPYGIHEVVWYGLARDRFRELFPGTTHGKA